MIVRRNFCAVAALSVLLLSAGCGDRGGAVLPAEIDEPFYVQGVQLKKQGRDGEALTAFLKVIDRRGERGAAESHLEAGEIYLTHSKDPAEAYHHLRKYLELQPNSKQADLVKGRVEIAKREFWRQLAGRPIDDQSVRLQIDEEISKLRRENEELQAQLSVLRGGGAMPVNPGTRSISVPIEPPRSAGIVVPAAEITNAPITPSISVPPSQPVQAQSAQSQQGRAAGVAGGLLQPAPYPTASSGSGIRPAPQTTTAPRTTAAAPTTSGAAQQSRTATPPAVSGKTHTVKAKESLFGIARQYGVKVEDLAAANGIKNINAVPIGAVLKIPVAASAPATRR